MALSTRIATAVPVIEAFMKFSGGIVADLKRRNIAELDIELMGLRRTELDEELDNAKRQLERAVIQQKAITEQDLISRGLSNTTLRQSMLLAIDRDAVEQIETLMREYNRTMEQIALTECKIAQHGSSWWARVRLPRLPRR